MISRIALAGLAIAGFSAPAIAQSYAPHQGATLRTLDKITGRSTDIAVELDNPVVFGSLTVVMRACFRTPPEEPPESAAFLQIYSQQARAKSEAIDVSEVEQSIEDTDPIFSGWMFASSPGLSALEHPVYDVWVIRCTAPFPSNEDGEDAGASTVDPEDN